MTNSKTTKRALFSSVVALLLCFTMLLGTTFAWFTDSASSDTNIISAGNLDVELYHADKAQPTDELVGSSTKLFDDVNLWEPGAIVWEKLTVKNNGTLALKYNLSVNVTEISSVGGKSLADVLKVAVLTEEPTRTNVASAATQSLASFSLKSDKALTSGNSDVVYVAIYWAPSANDNDYNIKEALTAKLGVTLMATQYTSESDSFDNQYDKDATYDGSVDSTTEVPEIAVKKVGTYSEFLAAIAEGGAIQLTSDIVVEDASTVISKDTTIDLNGQQIIGTRAYDGSNVATAAVLTVSGAEVTFDGAGKVENTTTDDVQNYAILVDGGAKIIINDGTYIADDSAVYVSNGEAVITGGFFEAHKATSPVADYEREWQGTTYTCYLAAVVNCSKGAYNNYAYGKTEDVAKANVDISGGTFVNEDVSNLLEGDFIQESHVIDGYKVVRTEQENGDAWYTVVAE